MTLYSLKPRFQALLRPAVGRLARAGATANQVTLAAAAGSLALGALVAVDADHRLLFALIPLWLLVRMALNAIDGMLAREFAQKTPLGAYLNEICDVVSDAALYLPFALVAPFGPHLVGLVILLAVLSEFAGVLGTAVGASRRYDGPMGKSDRALVFGLLGAAVALLPALPQRAVWILAGVALLSCLTIARRIRGGLLEAAMPAPHRPSH
jgi:CDP-diacylglycerol--glycerol-3-phosphate 3-phosphatidyltransferase